MSAATTVVLDTNALMMPVECDCRLFDEVERVLGLGGGDGNGNRDGLTPDYAVPAAVVAELEKLTDGNGAEATAARVGRDLADRCRTVETDASYADDAVVALAEPGDCVVTNDRPLRDRLLDRDVRVIGIRGETKLAVTRP